MSPKQPRQAQNLFAAAGLEQDAPHPLPDRLRPRTLSDVVGQDHILGPDGALTRMLATRTLGSLIFWGPPGTGKTTVARLLADATELHFEQLSAVFSGVADLKKAFDAARARREMGKGTLLFVDEVHRFNRAQQDSFLPVMEDGTVVLVGATTENPSFELNAALLSRARVLVFHSLDPAAVERLFVHAETIEGKKLPLDAEARAVLVRMADGDGRAAHGVGEVMPAQADNADDGDDRQREQDREPGHPPGTSPAGLWRDHEQHHVDGDDRHHAGGMAARIGDRAEIGPVEKRLQHGLVDPGGDEVGQQREHDAVQPPPGPGRDRDRQAEHDGGHLGAGKLHPVQQGLVPAKPVDDRVVEDAVESVRGGLMRERRPDREDHHDAHPEQHPRQATPRPRSQQGPRPHWPPRHPSHRLRSPSQSAQDIRTTARPPPRTPPGPARPVPASFMSNTFPVTKLYHPIVWKTLPNNLPSAAPPARSPGTSGTAPSRAQGVRGAVTGEGDHQGQPRDGDDRHGHQP